MPILKSLLKISVGITICMLIALMVYLLNIQYSGNISAIFEGEAYRSNQPDAKAIAELQTKLGIKTIINLRGEEPGERWYDEEVAATKALGITLINFGMSARKELPRERVNLLISLMENAEKPLLIHCKAGSDRTGLAAALYIAEIAKGSKRQAEAQLSIRFGHFGFPFSPTLAMERTFEALELALVDKGYP